MKLQRDAFGRLVLTVDDGQSHEGVVPVRAYPISAPDRMIALVGADGHELAWLDDLSALDAATRALIEGSCGGGEGCACGSRPHRPSEVPYPMVVE